ncbi:MAG: hypothetical protein NC432_06245 [Roseburia sp.]|nr:hypothetical protein [Roseburia sp.]MCM1097642.1 hypothetical protein [Ruminococcus flavefaciens]
MKILEYRQEELCYMWKDRQVRMEREDLWGSPEENRGSILGYCRDFSEEEEDDNAHVVYYYGQGGIGKSFVCGEIARRLSEVPYEDRLYVVAVDLQRQKSFEDNLKCLAEGIEEQLGGKESFPRFQMAYYNYKMKKGEEAQQEERSTKWDRLQDNDSFGLAAGVAGFLTSFGTVSDVIGLANDGYKWFLKMRDNVKYKALAHRLEAMGEKELKNELVRYFAADFRENVEARKEVKKKKKKFAFLLDTVESMRYQALRRGDDEDYLEWLAGSDGLFRLLPGCFWLLFGREEISWRDYDREWEVSFVSKEFEKPQETAVRDYLRRLLCPGGMERGSGAGDERPAIIEEIIRQTEGYSLGIENCVDVYFRIWNRNLRTNRVADENAADRYRPSLEEMREVLAGGSGSKLVSARFLQYYTLQEREVLYTLVCLGTWTDDILENVIWRGMSNNILIYEEMCSTSFIHTSGDGVRSIQGLMLDAVMEDCAPRLKKRLLTVILQAMKDRSPDEIYWLLFHSAIHTAGFCQRDVKTCGQLGEQLVRAAERMSQGTEFGELSEICGGLLKVGGGADEDLYNAAGIGAYFAGVLRKKDVAETLALLRGRERFGAYSLQVWRLLQRTAWYAGCFGEAYEITELLEERLAGGPADVEYYGLLRQKAELMQRLPERFESGQMEQELERVCSLAQELSPAKPEVAEKLNMRLWAEYHYNRRELWGEIASRRIGECIERYRACCTREEAEEDAGLCVMEIMRERAKGKFWLDVANEWALKGLRILERLYGERAAEQSDMSFLFYSVLTGVPMTKDDRELYRELFEEYYKAFYKGGSWDVFPLLNHACVGRKYRAGEDSAENGMERVELADILGQGILYLSNLSKNSQQNQLRLLLSYYLRGESEQDQVSLYDDGGEVNTRIQCAIGNNRVLLFFLQKLLEELCPEKEGAEKEGRETKGEEQGSREMRGAESEGRTMEGREKESAGSEDRTMKGSESEDREKRGAEQEETRRKIRVLLQAVFADRPFSDAHFTAEEKRQLLSLLRICGLDTGRAEWRAEYTDSAEGEEFRILGALRGWVWKLDSRADIQMAATLLYAAWRLEEPSLEKRLLELLEERFPDGNKRISFWFALRREAQTEGGEWESRCEELLREAIGKEDPGKNGQKFSVRTRALMRPYRPELEERLDSGSPELEESGGDGKAAGNGWQDSYETELQDRLAAGDFDAMRGMIQEVLNGFKPSAPDDRFAVAHFYVPALKKRGLDGFLDGIQDLAQQRSFLGGEYFILRAYAYLDDREGFTAYYRENREAIWERLKSSYTLALYPEQELFRTADYVFRTGEGWLAEDYCGRLADLYGSSAYGGANNYGKRILRRLGWLTSHVPVQTVWRRELFTEALTLSNYEEMYGLAEKYLERSELLDCFADWGRRIWKQLCDYPKLVDFSFFESEYYRWMTERFGEAFQERMEREQPDLYAAKREFEECFQKEYVHLVNSAVCRIRSLTDRM